MQERRPLPVAEFDDEDGRTWLESRLKPLCETLEVVRAHFGGHSIQVNSGYRTLSYNAKLNGSAKDSQHMKGRAADIVIDGISPVDVHAGVLHLYMEGKLPHLGGLGQYATFCHLDVRPRPEDNHLAQWQGARISNVA